MIGERVPWLEFVAIGVKQLNPAEIDAVHAQHRTIRGEGFGVVTVYLMVGFFHSQLCLQRSSKATVPVVKIATQDDWLARADAAIDVAFKFATVSLGIDSDQVEVHAKKMQIGIRIV